MPASIQLPGVYRQDIFPQPPLLFLTGVPVFLGYTEQGMVNQPVQLNNWHQFGPEFGEGSGLGYLAAAVCSFFANGGSFCHVVPLADSGNPENDLAAGLTAVINLENVDLVLGPDILWAAGMNKGKTADAELAIRLQQQLLSHCDQLGNRFCILDGLPEGDISQVISQRQALVGDSGALYYPWLKTPDGQVVPPSGHVAGIYSQTDQSTGVHKGPANVSLNNVIDLVIFNQQTITPVQLSYEQQETLFSQSINYLQVFPGRGIRIWGTRTISQQLNWQQINVRRLFITVGRWLEQFMAELPFADNDTQLWLRIRREVSAYLQDLYVQGALKGQTVDEAFFVKCDAETNPPEQYKSGMVITEIGLAPAKPAEFIQTRIIHDITGISIQQT